MKIYEQIDQIVEQMSPEELATYLFMNYEKYSDDLVFNIEVCNMNKDIYDTTQTKIWNENGEQLV